MNAAIAADGSEVSPWLVAVVVSLATFMEVLDTTITNVSLSHIAGSLAATPEESTWVLTSYLVANGIILPLSGWLSNVIGRKRFFMLCIAGFTVASFACGAATSLTELIVFRMLQGLCGGGLQPVQQAIILDAFPPEKRGAVFGITGITLIAAPVLGPTLGGLITDNFSWRWIFFINLPVGAFAFYMVGKLVSDPEHAKAHGLRHLDVVGLVLIAAGIGCLQLVLDKGQQEDWFESNYIVIAALIAAGSLIGAVYWLLDQKDPVVDLRLIGDPSFGLSMLLIFFVGFALYGSSALLPLLVQTEFGYDATLAGLVLSPGALLLLFLMPAVGKLVSRVQARYLIAIGLSLITVGMFYTMHVTPQTDYTTFVLMRSVQVLGLPFLFIPTSTLAFSNIPRPKSGKASALFSLARNLGGSVGIAIASTYVTRHTQIRQHQLAEHMVPGDTEYETAVSNLTHQFMAQGMSAAEAASTATGSLYRELLHQASVLAYADAYLFIGSLLAAMLVVTLFLPANRVGGKPDPAASAH